MSCNRFSMSFGIGIGELIVKVVTSATSISVLIERMNGLPEASAIAMWNCRSLLTRSAADRPAPPNLPSRS